MLEVVTPRRDIIVIGASSGSVRLLLDMAAALPVPASILLVQHIGTLESVLPELLMRRGRNPALHARSAAATVRVDCRR